MRWKPCGWKPVSAANCLACTATCNVSKPNPAKRSRLAGKRFAAANWRRREATVDDSLRLLAEAYAGTSRPSLCYQGELRPDAVAACMAARMERKKCCCGSNWRSSSRNCRSTAARRAATKPAKFGLTENTGNRAAALPRFELTLDDAPVAPPEDVRQLLTSIHLDLGEIPARIPGRRRPWRIRPEPVSTKSKPIPDDGLARHLSRGRRHALSRVGFRPPALPQELVRACARKTCTPVHDGFVAQHPGKIQRPGQTPAPHLRGHARRKPPAEAPDLRRRSRYRRPGGSAGRCPRRQRNERPPVHAHAPRRAQHRRRCSWST